MREQLPLRKIADHDVDVVAMAAMGSLVMGSLTAETCRADMSRIASFFSSILIFMALATTVNAHPFHICVGQMRWNKEEKYWELSLRLHPQDLEQSMQRWRLSQSRNELQEGRPVEALLAGCRVEDVDFESHAIEFLNQHFYLFYPQADQAALQKSDSKDSLANEPGSKSKLVWVGKEYEKAWVWLHMELHPPTQPADDLQLHLCHKVFLGEIPEQENSVLVEQSGRPRFSLQFKGEETAKPFVPEVRSSRETATIDGKEGDANSKK